MTTTLRQQLFIADAFQFDFGDVAEAEKIESAPHAVADAVSGQKTKAVTLKIVQQAWSECWDAGNSFAAVSRDEWPALRQRHRDCVARATKRLAHSKPQRTVARRQPSSDSDGTASA
jgi:hypothetical protein